MVVEGLPYIVTYHIRPSLLVNSLLVFEPSKAFRIVYQRQIIDKLVNNDLSFSRIKIQILALELKRNRSVSDSGGHLMIIL